MLIAKQEGFKDHKEMAEYMANKGYERNAYKNNYVKTIGKVEEKNSRWSNSGNSSNPKPTNRYRLVHPIHPISI